MKFWIIADLHTADKFREDVLYFIRQLDNELKQRQPAEWPQAIILAGDMFNAAKATGGELDLVKMLVNVFHCYGIERIVAVEGNHDPAGREALHVLLPIARLTATPIDIGGIQVAGLDFAPRDKILEQLRLQPYCDLLVMHESVDAWWNFSPTLQISELPAHIPTVVFGDIHEQHRVEHEGRQYFSIGSPFPCDKSQAEHDHGFLELECFPGKTGSAMAWRFVKMDCREYLTVTTGEALAKINGNGENSGGKPRPVVSRTVRPV